jgi:hypothetical protein
MDKQTCRAGVGRYGSGLCDVKGQNPQIQFECDYQWKNDIKVKTPCGDVKKSQFSVSQPSF